MTRGRRILLRTMFIGIALAVVLGFWVYVTLESEWFFDQVRTRIIATVEKATGGRVEIGGFRFDRSHFTAEVRGLILHGTEPADKPPLFRAASAKIGFKLLSLFRPSVDVLSLEVAEPKVYLVIGPDGRTNVPEPKVPSAAKKNAMETVLDLAVDRFHLYGGVFEIEARGATPIELHGRNLVVRLGYDASGPRYKGTLSVTPLDLQFRDYQPQPLTVNLGLTLERNRASIDDGRIASGGATVDLRGSLDDFTAPRAAYQYVVRTPLAELGRVLRVEELRNGNAMVAGAGTWTAKDGPALRGSFHATGVEYRDNTVRLAGVSAIGEVQIAGGDVFARKLRLSGNYLRGTHKEPVGGRVAEVRIRDRDLDIADVALTLLGGTFSGSARIRDLRRFDVQGEIAGIQAMRTVEMYSPEKLPWDALVYGSVRVQGAFGRMSELKTDGDLTLAPALSGDPVRGHVTVAWDGRTETLDLGRSAVTLPHSHAEFSGAIGQELRVHLETRDLNDLLPALGESTSTVPVKLNNGSAVFDGSVSGALASPRISGHLRASNVAYAGQAADLFEGDVTAGREAVRLQNGTVTRGALRAQLQGSVVMSDWKITDDSLIAGTATLRPGPLTELLAAVGAGDPGASGTVSANAFWSGSIGAPRADADVEIARGAFRGEPFDRLTAHASYSGHLIEVRQGQITAGAKQARVAAAYDYQPQQPGRGRLTFDIVTNAMPLDSIRTLREEREDILGTIQANLRGAIQLDASAKVSWRLLALNADVSGKSLEVAGQPVGDLHVTAQPNGQALRVHLDSTAAGAQVTGEGEWKLEGEYPGSAVITFAKLDLSNLRAWIAPEGASRVSASADGELQIQGPALDWKSMQAELRIPRLEIAPGPDSELSSSLRLTNQGPIVARYAKDVATVESFHLVGQGTDLTAGGRILTAQKQMDLRVDGHADLGLVSNLMEDVVARGTVSTNATIRGSLSDPQIVGRLEFQKASFNIADVPNGISNATGLLVFNKDRATIQSLSGETGGGKIDLGGFVQYAGAGPLVFRLLARAREVRVRYPEGVSTVANAALTLTGTQEASTLSGNITILRTGINLQSDFGSFLAKSAEPVRTPSAQPGLLGGMRLDVQVETAPETQFESSLTEGVRAEANLRLRGTVTNPAVLGRVTITEGKLTFFGTQYTVSQGTVNFYNPVKVEPIVNVDLETKARGIDVTLSVTGPLNKLALTPRSDPPLQFSEIIALLAQGRAPSNDPTMLRQQSSAPQTFQQAGASALLGSAIANPVAGRLQRFFGVSKLRIDPSLSGVENNPQARLTLEQQITPNVTFTYITNVTSSNPQVVRMEWAVSKQWSIVGLREENGLIGIDFFYKKRLK